MHLNGRLLWRDEFHLGEILVGDVTLFETERYEISRVILHLSFRRAVKSCHHTSLLLYLFNRNFVKQNP